ncbi:MAG: class I SAM-dependent methyltransferase [Crocosphaera sp.]
MSRIIDLTQEFYQKRQEAVDTQVAPEMLEANYVGWSSDAIQHQAFEIATNFPWLNWLEVESLLDVGCGYGRLLDVLISKKSYGGKYSGIDIVPEFIEKAIEIHSNQEGSPKTEFFVGDFLEQAFETEKFDVIICLGGLGVNQDYPQPCGQKSLQYAQRLISKIAGLSKSAISLYFPNADHIPTSERKSRMAYYTTSEIEAMLLEACEQRCQDITFVSYPSKKNRRTIVQLRLSSSE